MLIIKLQNLRSFAGTFMGFAFSPSLNGDSLKTVPSGHFLEVKKHHAPCPCGFYYLPMCRISGTAFLPQTKPMQAACRILGKQKAPAYLLRADIFSYSVNSFAALPVYYTLSQNFLQILLQVLWTNNVKFYMLLLNKV